MIANEMPILVTGGEIDQSEQESRNKEYRILLVLNIVASVLYMIIGIPSNIITFTEQEKLPLLLTVVGVIVPTFATVLQVISGVVLVHSVVKIRRFYLDKNIEQQLNTQKLLIHGSAFSFYLVAIVFYCVSWDLYMIFP